MVVGRTVLAQRQIIFMNSKKLAEADVTNTMGLPDESVRANSTAMLAIEVPVSPLALDIQSQIGRHLQAVYDEIVHEPVPARFLKLLQDLDRKKGGV